MAINLTKLPTRKHGLALRVAKGHFATNHSHTNYYIDVTAQKFRLSEAKAVAHELTAEYKYRGAVDTILCLDGTEVIGACMASDMMKAQVLTSNEHGSLYVVTPEHTTGSQLIFRENTMPMITGKHVLILLASVSTGYTADAAMQAIQYYGGQVVGIASIFASVKECGGVPVTHIFDTNDLHDYGSWEAHSCPLCQQGKKIEALVNSYGYSNL
ncbi:MAG: orotate phosphoribosyltransferase [Clostridia bacterium]|nr:orotate phosphoribosyltransferase [Clostridia bacterium]MBQ9251082.1 orotate phosphoribosyltransferase [Clostridia bacterium]